MYPHKGGELSRTVGGNTSLGVSISKSSRPGCHFSVVHSFAFGWMPSENIIFLKTLGTRISSSHFSFEHLSTRVSGDLLFERMGSADYCCAFGGGMCCQGG
jgi:hypothetical protein